MTFVILTLSFLLYLYKLFEYIINKSLVKYKHLLDAEFERKYEN